MLQALRKKVPLEERFWAKVAKTPSCWLWAGAYKPEGYGMLWYKGRVEIAHRVAWIMAGNKLPEAPYVLDHMCKVKSCVRADHLRVVLQADNCTLYADSPHGRNLRKDRCDPHGHPYTPENTILRFINGRPRRECKACRALRSTKAAA